MIATTVRIIAKAPPPERQTSNTWSRPKRLREPSAAREHFVSGILMTLFRSLVVVGSLFLAVPSFAQTATPAPAPSAAPAGDRITPEQARKAIETLQNDAKRNEIINTLRAIAGAGGGRR
jgi:hypothetical protein